MPSFLILHLITELDTGGAQKALARLLAHQRRFAPAVVCLYNGDTAIAREIRSLGVPVTDLGMTAKWRWDAICRLYRVLRRERPVILHTWMFHANVLGRIVGRLAGVSVIITSRRNVDIGGPSRELLKTATASLDDATVAVCDAARQAEIERAGARPDRVFTVYNGIDVSLYEGRPNGAIRREFGIPPSAPLIGYIGRLHRQKGVEDLLVAMDSVTTRVPDSHLLVVGEGECGPFLAKQMRSRGLSDAVLFTGTRHDVPQVLQDLDILVLPSLWEGLPNVILEAMASGLPVVATGVGGVPEIVVDNVTGFLVPPRQPEALSNAILRLVRDPDLRNRMGQAGRQRVQEHFSVDRMVMETEALYERLLAEKGLV